ncbi:MAG: thiamine phosphate synthase [Acidobacteriota bacterium]|nr:thiamine phosphate synthase [Acidobacteriota bacterium]
MSLRSRLYAIVDAGVASRAGWTPTALAHAYLKGGARLMQLRTPGVDTTKRLRWCREIAGMAARSGAQLIVNDRCDLVIVSAVAGVHLGQDDLPVEAARRLLGPEAIIGVSTHDDQQVAVTRRKAVNYIATGPVYPTQTKETGYQAVGLEAVRRTVALAGPCPVVAIGGITLATAPDLIEAGVASVAVISDLLTGGDPERRVRRYIAELGGPCPSEGL